MYTYISYVDSLKSIWNTYYYLRVKTIRRIRTEKTTLNQQNLEGASKDECIKEDDGERVSTESSIGSLRSLTDFTDVDQQLVLIKYFY